MCPDFLFFHGGHDDVKVSIVDPHGIHLSDALPKLRGLAIFAGRYGDAFHRIEARAEVDGQLKVLDIKEQRVRDAIEKADDAVGVYRSQVAANY